MSAVCTSTIARRPSTNAAPAIAPVAAAVTPATNAAIDGLFEYFLYNTGQPYVTFTIEAIRAIMRATPDEDDMADAESMVVARPNGIAAGAFEA